MWKTPIITLLAIATSCSKADTVNCGPGTVLRGGMCVVAAANNTSSDSGGSKSEAQPGREPASDTPAAAPDLADQLMEKTSLAEAVDLVRPMMSDGSDAWSKGGIILAMWAAAHLRWPDVEVKKNETSFALVRKDSEKARGKKMCTAGTIIQIEREGEV